MTNTACDSATMPMFPEAQVPNAYSYPGAESLTAWALFQFLAGRELSHQDAINGHGSYRLASAIHLLIRKFGWPIENAWRYGVNRIGQPNKWKSYWISPDCIQEAGERGQKFMAEVAAIWKGVSYHGH